MNKLYTYHIHNTYFYVIHYNISTLRHNMKSISSHSLLKKVIVEQDKTRLGGKNSD